MPRRRKGSRVLGPHFDASRGRWRVVFIDEKGRRTYETCETEAEGKKLVRATARLICAEQGSSIEGALEKYSGFLRSDKGNKEGSISTTTARIRSFFPDRDEMLSRLTATRCEDLYASLRKRTETDTHRNTLAEVKTFLGWCAKQKLLDRNPAAEIEGLGKRKKGKEQLRPTEARKLLDLALKESAAGRDGSFAVACALVLGPRQNGLTRRLVRDVDVLTRRLYIDGDKTAAGTRSIEIPEVLWPHFENRVADREPTEPLLPAKSKDGFHRKEWLNKNTKRLCKAAGVPVICAHGLRGTHASIAEESGASGHVVAKQLGHESVRTTREHYTRRSARETAQQKRVLTVLAGGKQ